MELAPRSVGVAVKRSPLKTFTRIERRTPLHSTRKPFPRKGDPGTATAASGAVPVSLEAFKFPKPSRARHPRGANPKVGGSHASRSKAETLKGASAQPLVALEGQQGINLPKFAKPAPRVKAARAPLPRSRMKAKRARRIDRETPQEKLYKAWIHTQPCVGEHFGKTDVGHKCEGAIEQSHERNMTGLGLKSNNLRSIPMCAWLHRLWEQHDGWFRGWSKEGRRLWFGARVDKFNARFNALYPVAA